MKNKHGFPLFSNRMRIGLIVGLFLLGLYAWDTWVVQTCYGCYDGYW